MSRNHLSHLSRIYAPKIVDLYSTGPVEEGIQIKASKSSAEPAEMLIYDAIGDDGWGGGVSARMVMEALATIGDSPLVVRLNSPGGDVFDGLAIYNALLNRPSTEIIVDGLAASAASIIAMAAPLTMQPASMLMIHNAWSLTVGNRDAMAAKANLLAKVDGQLADIYTLRTGLDRADIVAMLDAETWLTAPEADAMGFTGAVKAKKSAPSDDRETVDATVGASVETKIHNSNIEMLARRLRLALAD